MRLDDFDFELPAERIALRPAAPRDSARLLQVGAKGDLSDHLVRDLPTLLRPGDLMVFNDTRVLPARLFGRRIRGDSMVSIEATLHQRRAPDRWAAFLKPGRRVKPGDVVTFGADTDRACSLVDLSAKVVSKGDGGEVILAFNVSGVDLDLAVNAIGAMPLPPYIASKRPADEQDFRDYQTVYARETGSVAAPTAGLHFTASLLQALIDRGVEQTFVTLHVGAGTFLPVKSDRIEDHRMHAEWGEVEEQTVEAVAAARARGGRVIAVGTTALRVLESASRDTGSLQPWRGETDIFITPGFRFRVVDGLMTNFHLPRSTLFMLVCAFAGFDVMHQAYGQAIARAYRFYSYGDSSLLWRRD